MRPEFKVPLANVLACVGDTIKLECVVYGVPKPDLCWKLNSKPFMPTNANVSGFLHTSFEMFSILKFLLTKNYNESVPKISFCLGLCTDQFFFVIFH